MTFNGKTIFVTGGAGFIGSAVIRHLLDETEAFVVNIDKLTYASNLQSIPQGSPERYILAKEYSCNASALRALFETFQPQVVMHIAPESHVHRSINAPPELTQTNTVGTFTLLPVALLHFPH